MTTWSDMSGNARKDQVTRLVTLRRRSIMSGALNPGQWMAHCHNLYHAPQGGMMATLSYQT